MSVFDVVQRVKLINRAFERQQKESGIDVAANEQKTNVSFINTAN